VFDKIPVNELVYEDFRIMTMGPHKDYENRVPNINVVVIAEFHNINTFKTSSIIMLVVLFLSIIFFYLFSLAHFSKKIDGFRLCKRKPVSPETLARIKYKRELMHALGLTPKSKEDL